MTSKKQFKLKFWYLDQGMEGIPCEHPEEVIEAENEDMACFLYHSKYGTAGAKTFEEWITKPRWERFYATSCTELPEPSRYIAGVDLS